MERSVNHDSIQNMILSQLLSGRRITTISVLKSCRSSEARHFIAILRKTVKIYDVWVCKGTVRYKEYFISNIVTNGDSN